MFVGVRGGLKVVTVNKGFGSKCCARAAELRTPDTPLLTEDSSLAEALFVPSAAGNRGFSLASATGALPIAIGVGTAFAWALNTGLLPIAIGVGPAAD